MFQQYSDFLSITLLHEHVFFEPFSFTSLPVLHHYKSVCSGARRVKRGLLFSFNCWNISHGMYSQRCTAPWQLIKDQLLLTVNSSRHSNLAKWINQVLMIPHWHFNIFYTVIAENPKVLPCCPPFYPLVPTIIVPEPWQMVPDTDGWRKKGKTHRWKGGGGVRE